MPAWRDQSDAGLSSLAAVVTGFGPRQEADGVLPSMINAGEFVYVTHCAECHGDAGDGNGFAAGELPVRPSDFRGERPTLEESIRILRNGVEGTSMAPWTDRLSDDEIIAAYKLLAATEGVYAEPASAASIAGLVKLAAAGTIEKGATIACTLTGHGLKDPESAMRVCPEATRIPPDVDRALEVMKL